MAAGQTAESQNGTSGRKSRRRLFMIGGAVLLAVGLAAGAGLWRMQNTVPDQSKPQNVAQVDVGQALLPLGRMTINISAAAALGEKRSRYLVIEPTLLYSAYFDADEKHKKMPEYQAALRDSFIEFLSQMHENDVHGSAGLAELRAELLRRARVVTDSEAPIGILLQDFVLQ